MAGKVVTTAAPTKQEAAAVRNYVGKTAKANPGTSRAVEKVGSDARNVNYYRGAADPESKKKKDEAREAAQRDRNLAARMEGNGQQTQFQQEAQQPQQEQTPETTFTDEANKGKGQAEQQEATRYTQEANADPAKTLAETAEGKQNGSAWAKQRAEEASAELADLQADRLRVYQLYENGEPPSDQTLQALGLKTLEEYDDEIGKATEQANYYEQLAREADGSKGFLEGLKERHDQQMENMSKQSDNWWEDPQASWAFLSAGNEVDDQVSGWAKQFAAGPVQAVGTGLQWFDQSSDDMVRAEYDAEHGEGAYDRAIAGKNVNQLGQLGDKLWDVGTNLYESGQEDWERGTENLSDTGKTIANIAKTGMDVVGDAALNAVAPGLGTMRMYLGAAGGGAYEQSQRENNDIDSRAVNMVKNGLSAYLSNKLLGGLETVYGQSVLGGITDDLLKNASPQVQKTLKVLLNTEGLEEGLEDILNWGGDIILGLDTGKPLDWDEVKQDAFIGYVLGVVTNGLAGGMNIDSKKQQNIAREGIDFAESGISLDEAAEIGKRNTSNNVTMKPGADANVEAESETAAPEETAPEGETPAAEPKPEAPQLGAMDTGAQTEAHQWIRNTLSGGAVSEQDISRILSNAANRQAFTDVTGISLAGKSFEEARNIVGQASASVPTQNTSGPERYQRSDNETVATIQERGTISQREASRLLRDPDARAAFEEAYGISLEGKGETRATQEIIDAVNRQKTRERATGQYFEIPAAEPGNTEGPGEAGSRERSEYERDVRRWQQAQDDVVRILTGEDLSRKDATRLMNDDGLWQAFEEATGVDLHGRPRTEQNVREAVREAKANMPSEPEVLADAAGRTENTQPPANVPQGEGTVVPEAGTAEGQNPNAESTAPENEAETPANAAEGQSGVNTPDNAENAVEGGLNHAETNEGGNPLVTAAEGGENTGNQTENAEGNPNEGNGNRRNGRAIPNPNEGTDAEYNALLEKSGAIDQGENPARDIPVPKVDSKGMKTGEGVRTVMEASATPEERIASLKAAVVNGNFGHVPVDNDTRSKNAVSRIAKDGWSKAASDFMAAVDSGKVDADTIALGAHLLNEAGNSPDCNGRAYIELAMAYNDAVSGSAQATQAARILKTLTPEGKLYGMEKTVEKMNKEIRKRNDIRKRGKKQAEIKLNEDLVEEYLGAETDEAREEARQKLVKDAARQVPNTFADKITALRYLNMLGNFKTQVRNLTGNSFMTATQKVKNEVRSGIESLYKVSRGGDYERQYKGFYGKERLNAAKADFDSDEDIKSLAKGEKKWSSASQQANAEIQGEREYFSNKHPLGKFLNAYNKATGWAMDMGDVVFIRANYSDALAGYMNAHGWTAADWEAMVADPKQTEAVDKARSFAVKQAQEATFRDTNRVSKAISNFDKNWSKTGKTIAQGVIPFRKTPANVAVRMEEYSPLGFINTIYKAANVENGKYEVSDVIDSASKSLTGTALTVLGMLAAAHNKARTEDDDEDEASFNKLRGKQDYSVEFAGHSVTMDWLSPVSAPFFMGVEAWNMAQEGGFQVKDLLNVALSVTNPMMEMSMLSGINDALDNLSEFDGDNAALAQFTLNSAWSYLTQIGSNTLLGQIEQFSEKNRQTYYTDSDNPLLPGWAQKNLAKLGNKTPGVDYQAADYIDAWGRKQANDPNLGTRAWNTFLNPSYVSNLDEKATAADEVIAGLLSFGKNQTEKDKFPDVVPKTPSRNTTVNGKKLSPEEYETYAVTKGQESLKAVTDLIETDVFKNMDEFGQAEAIAEAYKYAEFLAGTKIAKARGEEYTGSGTAAEQYAEIMDMDDPVAILTAKTAYDQAVKAEDWDAVDTLISVIEGDRGDGKLSKEGLEYLMEKDNKIEYYSYLADNGVPTERAKQFDADVKALYTSEKRSESRASDLIRIAGSGKYTDKEADTIMNYERKVSQKSIESYRSRVQYQLEQAGSSGRFDEVWDKIEAVADGSMTRDDFRAWMRDGRGSKYGHSGFSKNNLKQAEEIINVMESYTGDNHVAGVKVTGFYNAAREIGCTPAQALEFYEHIDTNFNGSYAKGEINAAIKWAFGTGANAKAVRKYIAEALDMKL